MGAGLRASEAATWRPSSPPVENSTRALFFLRCIIIVEAEVESWPAGERGRHVEALEIGRAHV